MTRDATADGLFPTSILTAYFPAGTKTNRVHDRADRNARRPFFLPADIERLSFGATRKKRKACSKLSFDRSDGQRDWKRTIRR